MSNRRLHNAGRHNTGTPYVTPSPSIPGGDMDINTSYASTIWNALHIPQQVDPETRRAFQDIDKGTRQIMQNLNEDITTIDNSVTTIETNITNIQNDITNITDGTTPIPFTWKQYTGA